MLVDEGSIHLLFLQLDVEDRHGWIPGRSEEMLDQKMKKRKNQRQDSPAP